MGCRDNCCIFFFYLDSRNTHLMLYTSSTRTKMSILLFNLSLKVLQTMDKSLSRTLVILFVSSISAYADKLCTCRLERKRIIVHYLILNRPSFKEPHI